MQFRRYAIYDAGPDDLAAFGAEWLGWDAAAGQPLPPLGGAVTDEPRRYGFHATMKAPFRLVAGEDEAGLAAALDALCAHAAPVTLPRLTLTDAGGFLALRPRPQPPALRSLAARVVEALDRFRAPLTEAEIARRNPDRLSDRQRANLMRWGYPHVMEDFHYHMTLSGPVDGAEAQAVRAELEPRLAALLPDPHPVAELALMGEDDEGRFHLIHRAALRG